MRAQQDQWCETSQEEWYLISRYSSSNNAVGRLALRSASDDSLISIHPLNLHMPQIEKPLADNAKLILGVSMPHTLCSRRVLSHPGAQTEILRPAGCTRTEEKKDGHPLFSDKEGLEDPRAWTSIKICHDDKERIQKDCFVVCLIPASFITTDTETNTSCVLGSNRRNISGDGCLEWNRIADEDP